jgi:5-methylthioadenosine/S-adenosylhomocysteine deaminase
MCYEQRPMTSWLITADAVVGAGDGTSVLGPTDVLVRGGAIAEVAPAGTIRADVPRLDWSGRAILPGGVNAHNHSFQSLLRGFGDDLPFLEWRAKALYKYSPRLDAEGVHVGALFAFGEMLLSGTTTVCDFFYLNDGANECADAVIDAARRVGIRIVMARCFYDWDGAPAQYREAPARALANFERLVASHPPAEDGLVSIHAAPHSLHGASPEMIRTAHGAARAAGVPLHIHLAEERYQVDDALEAYGKRPLFAAESLGVVDGSLVAVHGCWFDEAERALLAERGGALAYNPASNMFLGDGVTDVVDLHRRGVRMGLGTDGGCSNSRVSVYDEMRSCALLQKVHRVDGQAIDAETCFALGTRGGADLLRLPIGRIRPGARADLVAVDLHDPSLWPVQSLAKNVVYSMTARAIRDVLVDGHPVVTAGRLQNIPIEEIEALVRKLTHDWR